MSHLKSSTRLFLLAGVLSALLLAIGILGLSGIRQSNDALKTVYQDRMVAIGLLGDIQHQLLRGRLLIDASVLDPRPQASAGNLAELGSTSAVISRTWADYKAAIDCVITNRPRQPMASSSVDKTATSRNRRVDDLRWLIATCCRPRQPPRGG
jgi:hypothetical protein